MNDEALHRRSAGFRRFTQRKGMPDIYGRGKEPVLADKRLPPEPDG
jgi:hypothetical protein